MLAFAAACAFLLAAWLLVPRERGAGQEGGALRVCIVDASASARRTRPDWLAWTRRVLAEEAGIARASAASFAVISFAGGVAQSYPSGSPEGASAEEFLRRLAGQDGPPFDPRDGAGSDQRSRLAEALELAEGLTERSGPSRSAIVLVGAGRFDGRDPDPVLARLRSRGTDVELRPLPAPALADLGVRSIVLPAVVEAGAPLVARVGLFLTPGKARPLAAALEFELEHAGERVRRVHALDLPGESDGFTVTSELGPAGIGRTEVRVRARLEPAGDPIPENDSASASTRASGALVIAVLAEEERLEGARAWLAPSSPLGLPGIQFVFSTPEALPELADEVDALVTYDLAPRALPQALLEHFVRRGGGWLATSGWSFLEARIPGPEESALAEILPLEPALPQRGPRDVVLVVDGSGSMEGAPFETVRAACPELVSLASPLDEVSLRFFTAGLELPVVLKSAEVAESEQQHLLQQLLALRVPRGDTEILSSLEELARERARSAARSKREALVLLLTDGREREAPDDTGRARARTLLDELARVRARLRVIAIGEDADLEFLSTLVPAGQEVLRPDGIQELEAVFRREISDDLWKEGRPLEARAVPAVTGPLGSIVADVFAGEELELPPLSRMVRNRVRPFAEVAWTDGAGDPLLAIARVALGRVALFGSLPEADWAEGWSAPGPQWGALLRWLGRGPARREDRVHARLEGARVILETQRVALGPTFDAPVLEAPSGAPSGLGNLRFDVPATVVGPFSPGLREARLPHDFPLAEGPFLLEIPADQSLVSVPARLADEFDPQGRELALGPTSASQRPAASTATSERGDRQAHPSWKPVLAAALLLALGAGLLLARAGRGSPVQGIARSSR